MQSKSRITDAEGISEQMLKQQIQPQCLVRGMVSTVITSFNKAPYLAECIESALSQDYAPQEVLVVDDGSTDNTRDVAKSFGSRIHYEYQENQGQAAAKNKGICLAHGEYVAFLDGDDRWRAGKLQKQVNLLESVKSVAVVYSHTASIREGSGWEPRPYTTRHGFRRGAVLDDLLLRNFIPFSSAVARHRCLVDVGMFDETLRFAVDYELWLRMARKYSFDYVDEILVDYRVGIDSVRSDVSLHGYCENALSIQRNFVQGYYGGKYPRTAIARKAAAAKFIDLGDGLLGRGDHFGALLAHGRALRFDYLDPMTYYRIIRDLVPNSIVARCRPASA